VQKFRKSVRFDKVTESSKVGTFLRHSLQSVSLPHPATTATTNTLSADLVKESEFV